MTIYDRTTFSGRWAKISMLNWAVSTLYYLLNNGKKTAGFGETVFVRLNIETNFSNLSYYLCPLRLNYFFYSDISFYASEHLHQRKGLNATGFLRYLPFRR